MEGEAEREGCTGEGEAVSATEAEVEGVEASLPVALASAVAAEEWEGAPGEGVDGAVGGGRAVPAPLLLPLLLCSKERSALAVTPADMLGLPLAVAESEPAGEGVFGCVALEVAVAAPEPVTLLLPLLLGEA